MQGSRKDGAPPGVTKKRPIQRAGKGRVHPMGTYSPSQSSFNGSRCHRPGMLGKRKRESSFARRDGQRIDEPVCSFTRQAQGDGCRLKPAFRQATGPFTRQAQGDGLGIGLPRGHEQAVVAVHQADKPLRGRDAELLAGRHLRRGVAEVGSDIRRQEAVAQAAIPHLKPRHVAGLHTDQPVGGEPGNVGTSSRFGAHPDALPAVLPDHSASGGCKSRLRGNDASLLEPAFLHRINRQPPIALADGADEMTALNNRSSGKDVGRAIHRQTLVLGRPIEPWTRLCRGIPHRRFARGLWLATDQLEIVRDDRRAHFPGGPMVEVEFLGPAAQGEGERAVGIQSTETLELHPLAGGHFNLGQSVCGPGFAGILEQERDRLLGLGLDPAASQVGAGWRGVERLFHGSVCRDGNGMPAPVSLRVRELGFARAAGGGDPVRRVILPCGDLLETGILQEVLLRGAAAGSARQAGGQDDSGGPGRGSLARPEPECFDCVRHDQRLRLNQGSGRHSSVLASQRKAEQPVSRIGHDPDGRKKAQKAQKP